jgi:hypothetical protein
MTTPISKIHSKPPKTPRLLSLLHRLQHAKDAAGQPSPLIDELLFFLDDPPPGTGDRWEKGADLCRSHGIETSRVAVWRFYRANILQWRRDQNPAPPAPPPDPAEIARLHDQARHLAALRALDLLHDPRLSPGHLIGLIQNDNTRQQIQLTREQFTDRVAVRTRLEQKDHYQRLEDQVRRKVLAPAQMESYKNFLATLLSVSPHSTS